MIAAMIVARKGFVGFVGSCVICPPLVKCQFKLTTAISSRPGTKVGASKTAPDLPIKGGTKGAAALKKRTSGLPTGSFLRREAKNPVRAGRKPLARYGAVEGALARDLLLPGSKLDAD